MFRILFFIVLIVTAGIGFAWYSAQSLPTWYEQNQAQSNSSEGRAVNDLTQQIKQQGAGAFLSGKLADVARGKLVLNNVEFNALLQASLQSSKDGRRFLAISDAVNATISDKGVELGAVVNLNKLAQYDAKTRRAVDKLRDALPLLNDSKMFISVSGQPIARNGNLAFKDDITISLGSIPVSSAILKKLGVPMHRVSSNSLPIKYMSLRSVQTSDNKIELGVIPRF